jgi:hypothetical protein
MKFPFYFCALSLGPMVALAGAAEGPTVTERGPHHRVVQTVKQVINHAGEVVQQPSSYVELATGLHYQTNGQWMESQEAIVIQGNEAVALQGQHKVRFAANINSRGAIDLTTGEGVRLRSHVIGLSYFDTSTGNSAMIAEIKDSTGQVSGNQVTYPDAFTDFKADIRYTYRRGGFEQDIIIKEQPPSPSEYGMNPTTTRLEVLSEFVDAPTPVRRTEVLRFHHPSISTNAAGRLDYGRSFVDETVGFGGMRMGPGAAFPSHATGQRVPVGKRWQQLEGRDFLIEAVEYPAIKPVLDTLPLPPQAAIQKDLKQRVGAVRVVPVMKTAQLVRPLQMVAKIAVETRGVVIDYDLSSNLTNYTLRGDTTYHVLGPVALMNATIEGGCVAKFATNGSPKLTFSGTARWPSEQYHPAVFTAADDSSIGEPVGSGTPGTNLSYYATVAIENSAVGRIQNVRVSYAATAIKFSSSSTFEVANAQILNSGTAIEGSGGGTVNTRNLLINNVGTAYKLDNFTAKAEHVTVNVASNLFTQTNLTASCMFFTNSLIVNATNIPSSNLVSSFSVTTNVSGVFQTVGAGEHYLANSSPISITRSFRN